MCRVLLVLSGCNFVGVRFFVCVVRAHSGLLSPDPIFDINARRRESEAVFNGTQWRSLRSVDTTGRFC